MCKIDLQKDKISRANYVLISVHMEILALQYSPKI